MVRSNGGPMHVRVCGEVAVCARDGTWLPVRGRQPEVVLAYLAVESGVVRREALADELWGDQPSDHWAGALRGVLSKVRGVLTRAGFDAGALRSERTNVHLVPPGGVLTDVTMARSDIEEADRLLASSDVGRAAAAAGRARDTLIRPFLVHHDGEWTARQRLHIETLERRAAHVHVQALLGEGRAADAAAVARDHVSRHPFDEGMQHELIASLLAAGWRSDAVRAFHALRELLGTELGIAPDARTAGLLEPLDSSPSSPPARQRRPTDRVSTSFVGRTAEYSVLEAAWQRVREHRRPEMVVLSGPAGIGKTWLARLMCEDLATRGAIIAWGSNRSDDGRAFGAMADALSMAIEREPVLLDRAGARAAGLAPLLPELRSRFPEHLGAADHAEARTRLFAGARAVLRGLAQSGAVLVLDDLHWAADDTLAMFEAALDELDGTLLVVATARETPDRWEDALLGIQRLLPVQTVRLEGLSADELAQLLAGHPPPLEASELALGRALHERTSGLPFFVAEIVRDARTSDTPIVADRLPPAIRDWIRRRTTTLPASLRDVVQIAAVIGEEVDLGLLRRCLPGIDAERAVEELVRHGLLMEGQWETSVRFSHAITRDVVYESLGAGRRARLHGEVADALLALPSSAGLTETLAHHARAAGPERRREATAFAWEAGRGALTVGAWDRAAEHFQHSLDSADSPIATARATIGLGQARLRQRRFDEARVLLEDAAAISLADGLPIELAEATLAIVGRRGRGAAPDRAEQVERLRTSRAALARDVAASPVREHRRHTVLQSRLEQDLAISLLLTDAVDERAELVDSSLRRARELSPPDPSTLAGALMVRRILPEMAARPHERLRDIDEASQLPTNRLPLDLRVALHCYRHEDLVQVGDHVRAGEALATAEALIDEYPDPYWQWVAATWRGLRLMIEGDLEAAEAHAEEAHARLQGVDEAVACLGVNLVNIRLLQGRATEVLELLSAAADGAPHIPCYRAVLALAATEAGESALAERSYCSFADAEFESLPLDSNRFLALAVLGHVAADLGDEGGGRVLEGLLAPFDGQSVVLNCFGGGGAHWGPVSWVLARLARLGGRDAEAGVRYEQACAEATDSPVVRALIERHLAHGR